MTRSRRRDLSVPDVPMTALMLDLYAQLAHAGRREHAEGLALRAVTLSYAELYPVGSDRSTATTRVRVVPAAYTRTTTRGRVKNPVDILEARRPDLYREYVTRPIPKRPATIWMPKAWGEQFPAPVVSNYPGSLHDAEHLRAWIEEHRRLRSLAAAEQEDLRDQIAAATQPWPFDVPKIRQVHSTVPALSVTVANGYSARVVDHAALRIVAPDVHAALWEEVTHSETGSRLLIGDPDPDSLI
jgi:hypothetical protein